MNNKIDKNYINSLPQLYKDLGEERFFIKMEHDKAIHDMADMVLAKSSVLVKYRSEYLEEYNHLIALNKAIKKYDQESQCSFWTYLITVLSCSVIDYARKKAVQFKRYYVTEEVYTSSGDVFDDSDVEQKMTNEQLNKLLWSNINKQLNNLHTEIIKLKSAGFKDKEIRKRLKIKQSEIEQAKAEVMKIYEIEM